MKLSAAERRIVLENARKIAAPWTRARAFHIEAGTRYNIDDKSIPSSVNMLKVTKLEDWDDTDLDDKLPYNAAMEIPLTEDGRAIVDLYLYEKMRGDHGDLVCNMQLEIRAGELVAIHADVIKNVWTKET